MFSRQRAAKVFLDHGDAAREQVAEVVGKIGVDTVNQRFVGVYAVASKGDFAQQKIADGIHAVALAQYGGIDDVAEGFGHLAAVEKQPAVAEHFFRQRQVERHEHGWPDDRVEPDDLLAYKVHVARPVSVEVVVRVVSVTERSDIVGERVNPYINDVLLVKADRDAPIERRAGHAEVLQAGLQKVIDHFVEPGLGLNKVRMGRIVLHQFVLIC